MIHKVIFLYSALHMGDVGHVNEVYQSLAHELSPLERVDIQVDYPDYQTHLEHQLEARTEHPLIYAAGEKGFYALRDLLSSTSFGWAYTAVGLHQYILGLEDVLIDHLILPERALPMPSCVHSSYEVTSLLAVPASLPSLAHVKEAYGTWEAPDKPPLGKPYLFVMLPGDAPLANGQVIPFTKASAQVLFHHIETLWRDRGGRHTVLIHNGPRTGKHDPETGSVVCDHVASRCALDHVSRFFVALMESSPMIFHFYPFVFLQEAGALSAQSVYLPLLYLISSHPDSVMVMPGESVSILGQVPHYLSPDQAIVFQPSSMNPSHEKVFEGAFKRGVLSTFDERGQVVSAPVASEPLDRDGQRVAKALVKGYGRKFQKKKD